MTAHWHRVLVVDDDDAGRYALVRFLEVCGFDAVGATGGDDALRQLRAGLECCAVVTDVVMPIMDGWALVDALRADPALAGLFVVMLSGAAAHAGRALRLGVRVYLTKPIDPQTIAAAVAEHCIHTRP